MSAVVHQWSYRIGGIGAVLVGRIVSGTIRPRMRICVGPEGAVHEVKSLEVKHNPVQEAGAGDVVGVAIWWAVAFLQSTTPAVNLMHLASPSSVSLPLPRAPCTLRVPRRLHRPLPYMHRGAVVSEADFKPAGRAAAFVVHLALAVPSAVTPGRDVEVHCHTARATCRVTCVAPVSGWSSRSKPPRDTPSDTVSMCEVRFFQPAC
jgi:translation elongation factor EF-1alpha